MPKYMCFITGAGRPKRFHDTLEIAQGEQQRLFDINNGTRTVHLLQVLGTLEATNPLPEVIPPPKKAKAAKPVKTEPLLTQAQIDYVKAGGSVSVSFNIQKEPIVLPEKKAPLVIVRKVRVPVLPS